MNPTFTQNGFDGSSLSDVYGSFTNSKFGGYVVSGTIYTSELCFGTYNCKFIKLYGVDSIKNDNWLYDINGAYGIIGVGPRSHIWEGFADPDTRLATYSIELGQVSFYGSNYPSNITFGSANDEHVQGQTNLTISADASNFSYPVSNFSFGKIYRDSDNVTTSEYFYEIVQSGYPVTFATNFKGIGLPSDLYVQFVTLFEYVTGGVVECNDSLDGYCVLPGNCEDYSAYTDFVFKLNFTDSNEDNFMWIPLSIFAD